MLGSVTTVGYDCLDRIAMITDALGHSKHFSYDALGNITGITDENVNETKYLYSPTGELTEAIDALGHSTKYGYDKSGRMARMEQYRTIDEKYADIRQIEMQITTWERNKCGEVTKKSAPLGGESHYRYDPLGNLVSQIDEDGFETLYEYNLANRLEKVAYADGKTVELGYNALRQLTQLKDWLGTTSIELDPLGRATKVTDHDGNEIGYAWDALSRRESITYPDKSTVNYSYDLSGRIKSVTSETGTTQYKYNIADRLLERIMPGNIVTQQRTDPLGRLESLTHSKNDEMLDSFKYGYDPAGNIVRIEKHRSGVEADSGVFGYAYDKLGRLTEAKSIQGSKQYHYDSLGNRIMSIHNGIETRHSYNARNQLVRTTEPDVAKEYGYDARGNLTRILENGAINSAFTFNAANRMVGAATPKGKAEYEYNGFLKRVRKLETLQGTTVADPMSGVKYTLDLTKPYNDLIAIGKQRFVWGNELLRSEGSDDFSYLSDHLGSPIRLVGTGHDEILAYDEFGVPAVEANTNSTVSMQNPFGFTGYQPDNVSGLQYAQARFYEPTLGRFGAEDTHWHPENMIFGDIHLWLPQGAKMPISEVMGQTNNLYGYCIGNPLIYVDRTGKIVGTVVGGLIGGIVGGVSAAIRGDDVLTGVVSGATSGAIVGAAADFVAVTGGLGAVAVVGTMAVAGAVGAGAGSVIDQVGNQVRRDGVEFSEAINNIDLRRVGVDAALGFAFGAASGGLGLVARNAHRTSIDLYRSTLLNSSGIPLTSINSAYVNATSQALRQSAMSLFCFEVVSTAFFNIASTTVDLVRSGTFSTNDSCFETTQTCE